MKEECRLSRIDPLSPSFKVVDKYRKVFYERVTENFCTDACPGNHVSKKKIIRPLERTFRLFLSLNMVLHILYQYLDPCVVFSEAFCTFDTFSSLKSSKFLHRGCFCIKVANDEHKITKFLNQTIFNTFLKTSLTNFFQQNLILPSHTNNSIYFLRNNI